MKESKIAPGVCPGTEQTDPLMPIGGYPADTMASQGLSWDWWGRSQVQKMGVERHQGSQSILQISFIILQYCLERGLQIRFFTIRFTNEY